MSKFVVLRQLKCNIDIEKAEKILYKCHIKENKNPWKFGENNPSKLRIEICKDGNKKLVDKYSNNAYWMGAFIDNELIGCMRGIIVNKNDKLEMETYPSFPHSISKKINIILTKLNCKYRIECNRTCILPKYRKYKIRNFLIASFPFFEMDKNATIIHTLPTSYPKQYIEYNKQMGSFIFGTFRYEQTDPSQVYVICSPPIFGHNMINISKKNFVKTNYDQNNKVQEMIYKIDIRQSKM